MSHIEFYQDLQSHYKFFKEHLRACAEVPNSGHRGFHSRNSLVIRDKLQCERQVEARCVAGALPSVSEKRHIGKTWKKEAPLRSFKYLRPFPVLFKKKCLCMFVLGVGDQSCWLEHFSSSHQCLWCEGLRFVSFFFGGGGVFLLEVQYSILKSLISTCVLSYVGSREDWLLDRICESKSRDRKRRASYPYQLVER